MMMVVSAGIFIAIVAVMLWDVMCDDENHGEDNRKGMGGATNEA